MNMLNSIHHTTYYYNTITQSDTIKPTYSTFNDQNKRYIENYKTNIESEFIKINMSVSNLQFIHKLPKLIHFVWISVTFSDHHKEMDESHKKNVQTFYKIYGGNYGWKIIIWNNKNIHNVFCNRDEPNIAVYKEICSFLRNDTLSKKYNVDLVIKADILRLVIMYTFGGMYFDTDFVALQDLSDIIDENIDNHGLIVCNEENGIKPFMSSGFFVSYPNNRCVQVAMNNVMQSVKNSDRLLLGANERTGPYFWKRAMIAAYDSYHKEKNDTVFQIWNDTKYNALLKSPTIISKIATQIPTDYMYPVSFNEKNNYQKILRIVNDTFPNIYAIHLWDGSWLTHKLKNNT